MTMRRLTGWLLLGLVACSSSLAHGPATTSPHPAGPPEPPPSGQSAKPIGSRAPAGSGVGYEAASTSIQDHVELPEAEVVSGEPARHPLDAFTQAELERAVIENPAALGSMSIGQPSGGLLLNGVKLPPGPLWERVDPARAWGTEESIEYLTLAIKAVNDAHPGSPKLRIGHISARGGGPLAPHVSHQSGRDVDVSYYYLRPETAWYTRAGTRNLDCVRTWSLVRALLIETDVEFILMDHSIQRLLRRHAVESSEDPQWVQSLFQGEPGRCRPIILHAPGHDTHIHIRFYNPVAQETARRVYHLLVKHGRIDPIVAYVRHRVRKGETLGGLARKYGTSIQAIQKANHLRSTLIQAGRTYRIPKPEGLTLPSEPIAIPARRLPPAR